ncbi:hypothetical protein EDM21_03455 [Paenibacillus sp. N10]|uniref:Methylamine utilisation protein MauE domain-containing protein n=2 Tax=Paenibacillus lutrae TaxID=2078573 RepID=A0A7X3JY51_9BACL|nr:MauE/DoxX family redox-associated membrane protein [Paenibacillus lutrae]MVO98599.1 hypothetical protein [Paenibacillus lutrae]
MSILFFIPFYIKLFRFPSFRIEMFSYGVLPRSLLTLAAVVVITVEFILFVLFATGLLDGWKELAAASLLAVFALFSWRKTKMTGIDGCACYGDISFLNRFPVLRNLILIGLLVLNLLLQSEARDPYMILNSIIFVTAFSFSIEIIQSLWKRRNRRSNHEQPAVPL